ncbi:MAG TPA: VWA domain-containing protein, partial [Armatimonadota bacterium]|nr:VWA domain-containing protein [Armatimonadota bacterium]
GGFDPARTQMAGPPQKGITLQCIPGNKYALSTRASREHLLVSLMASNVMGGARMPLNLCLIIDRSGSMEGEPLEYVKRACGYVVDLLEPNDVLSIVAFEERVEVIMPARKVINKALIKEHINRLDVGNTTNLFDGIAAGASQIASVYSGNYVNRALLFTDGDPTAGIKDFSSIVGLVGEQKSRGITITALGFGNEYNEELLAGIARKAGGNYYYITRPDLIPEVFRKELETLMTVVARNLKLRINLSRWVQVRQIYGHLPTFGNRTAETTLPDVERGSAESALVELEFGPRPAGTYRVARVEVTYDDSVTGRAERLTEDVVLEFTPDEALVAANVNQQVQREIEVALASRNLERTVMGMRTQQISPAAAVQELERTMSILVQQGKTLQAQEIQQAIDNIKQGAGVEKTLVGTIYNLDRGKGAK